MKKKAKKKPDIIRLLEATENALGLSLCIHDFFQKLNLPNRWQKHSSGICAEFRDRNFEVCKNFDGKKIHEEISQYPNGRIHRCPFGLAEIVLPIKSDDMLTGVLFAGKRNNTSNPDAEGVTEDKQEVLSCVAERIGAAMSAPRREATSINVARRREIMSWLEENMADTPNIDDLADRLHLSASRTGKVIKSLFLCSFTELVQSTKLNIGAYWLSSSSRSVGEISLNLGFCDQAYFCRLFSRRFGKSPMQYRKEAEVNQIGS